LKQSREQISAWRRRSVVPDPGLGCSWRADGSARTVRQEGAAAHPRHL